jgi:hypothetical protein
MKDLGVRAGVPDLMFIHEGKSFGIELKAMGGLPTDSQLAAIDAINAAGGYACSARGLDRAIAVLESWGILTAEDEARRAQTTRQSTPAASSLNAGSRDLGRRKAPTSSCSKASTRKPKANSSNSGMRT